MGLQHILEILTPERNGGTEMDLHKELKTLGRPQARRPNGTIDIVLSRNKMSVVLANLVLLPIKIGGGMRGPRIKVLKTIVSIGLGTTIIALRIKRAILQWINGGEEMKVCLINFHHETCGIKFKVKSIRCTRTKYYIISKTR